MCSNEGEGLASGSDDRQLPALVSRETRERFATVDEASRAKQRVLAISTECCRGAVAEYGGGSTRYEWSHRFT